MLTNTAVKAARPRAAAYKLADEQGLLLHVLPTGAKSWRFRYRDPATRREQTLTFGLYPLIDLTAARFERDRARELLARGEDPRAPAGGSAQVRTFNAAARAWHAHHTANWSPVHAGDVMTSLERDVFPAIGACALGAIDQPAVLALLEVVEDRGAIETARRLRQRIGAVYSYARAKGWTTAASPADVGEALDKATCGGRQPALVDADELRALMEAVAALDATPILRLASRFLALTAVRLGSVRGMLWGEIEDLDGPAPLWRVPAAHLKLRVAQKADPIHDHYVPLSTAAAATLRAVRAIAGGAPAASTLVFPGRRGRAAQIGEGAIGGLYIRAGYAGRHVPHGWRAAFSTVMNRQRRADRDVIDMTLGHLPKGMTPVEAAYNREQHLSVRREILEEWGALIAPLV